MADKRTLRQVTDTHKKAQIVIAQATGVGEMELVQRLIDGAVGSDDFIAQSVGLNQIGHEQAVRLAETYVRDVRGLIAPELVELPTVGVPFDYGQSAARAVSTVKAVEARLEEARRKQPDSSKELVLDTSVRERLQSTMRRWTQSSVANAHRDTVIRAAESAGSGWRVVTDGKPCAFCAMLASYGEDVNGAQAWPDHYFHPDCGCVIQEVPLGMEVEFTEREKEFIRLREQAEKEADKYEGNAQQRLVAAMRANGQGVINDAIGISKYAEQWGGSTKLEDVYKEKPSIPSWWNEDQLEKTLKGHERTRVNGKKKYVGGHAYGAGIPGKTEFPKRWSTKDIEIAVFATWDTPSIVTRSGDRTVAFRVIDDVLVGVEAYGGGQQQVFRTAHPVGGRGVMYNDPARGRIERRIPPLGRGRV